MKTNKLSPLIILLLCLNCQSNVGSSGDNSPDTSEPASCLYSAKLVRNYGGEVCIDYEFNSDFSNEDAANDCSERAGTFSSVAHCELKPTTTSDICVSEKNWRIQFYERNISSYGDHSIYCSNNFQGAYQKLQTEEDLFVTSSCEYKGGCLQIGDWYEGRVTFEEAIKEDCDTATVEKQSCTLESDNVGCKILGGRDNPAYRWIFKDSFPNDFECHGESFKIIDGRIVDDPI